MTIICASSGNSTRIRCDDRCKAVLALVPARGGSKGVPRKNIRIIGGKPMMAWTIEAARASRYIDRLVLSSDDQAIIDVAVQCGCEAPFDAASGARERSSRQHGSYSPRHRCLAGAIRVRGAAATDLAHAPDAGYRWRDRALRRARRACLREHLRGGEEPFLDATAG